ncbi:MAG: lamin tail domain-containing protein [Verrucomicrobiales bacterium]|nr:lamin tail domain-containing protein [Verrucomicrobiales bacterium]
MPLNTSSWEFRVVLWTVVLSVGAASVGARPVLNEIHYDPSDKTEPAEFVELHNPDSTPVALGGWRLSGGVEFAFPAGISLPAGGYLVVGQDPAYLRQRFNVEAHGPWTGRLRNRGDRLQLVDASGQEVDRVSYQLGFPWPTVGEAPGYSIELLHPSLDNDLGGNWRASVVGGAGSSTRTVVIEPGQEWRYRKGTAEASNPVSAWREPSFDDANWAAGRLPIGYDPALALGTPLADMRGQYVSVFLRRTFDIADPGAITALELQALYDDGFRVWINGQQVLNANLDSGDLAFDTPAGPARESDQFETFEIPVPPGLLRTGANRIAVQIHNSSLNGSSDCYFDARLAAIQGPTGRGPSPGRPNMVFSPTAPPAVRQVAHAPRRPRNGESVRVSAKVTDPEGVASVILGYQVVEPGAYIELADAEFETRWTTLTMRDDGSGGDEVSGDDIYTVTLPAEVQQHRRLVRYRIDVADTGGARVRVPYADDPQPNFAYFVYDGVPAWTGAIRPGATGELARRFTVDTGEMNRLPVLHLIAKQSAVEQSTWLNRYGGDAYPWSGTLVFNGEVYDHIRHRARGGVWRYAMCKNMWKFDFNRGHDFEAIDDWGRSLGTRWTKLNLGASIQQGDFQHRGEQGLFESVGFRVFQLAGVPAMHSAYVQFRVIDGTEEAVAADQYDGDFWGVYLMLEQPDGRFLEQHDLPDGNLYKMEGGGGELNNLGPAGPADNSDLSQFLRDYNQATENWWRANLDVPSYLSYQTVVQAIHHYDICYDKNFFYYRNPESQRWQVIPWDLDLTWAENMYDAGCGGVDRIKQRLLSNAAQFPAVWRQWQNRIREFRDLFWNSDEAARLIDEQAGRLRGPATGPTLLDADRARWDYNPKMMDSRYSTSPSSKAGFGRYYSWPDYSATEVPRDFSGAVALMKRYVGFRATNASAQARPLDAIAADTALPSRPRVTYSGAEGFPANALRFRTSAYVGGTPFAAMRWRIGEITRPASGSWASAEPWKYEIQPTWESGRLASFTEEIDVPAEALSAGKVYRARAQFEDAMGRTSSWSEPVEFVAAQASNASGLARDLRITEIMYDSADGAAYDFVELHNAGSTTLSLAGAQFVEGITFTFPAGATLAPGAYALVVRAAAASNFGTFRTLYGLAATVPIFGPYSGNLADAGERIVLQAAGGTPDLVRVTYSDGRGWPVAADIAGHSLVPVKDVGPATGSAMDYGRLWRASTWIRGSPGAADPTPEFPILLNEIVAHTDFLSEFDSNDWVELYNPKDTPFTFGTGWYLSDDPEVLRKWQIPSGRVIPAKGFLVFDEVTGFNNPTGSGFSINKAGESVFLSYFPPSTPGRVVDAVSFKAQENEWALARVPDGGSEWDQVIPRTPAQPNAALLPRIEISEVQFHEGGLPTNTISAAYLEYLEVHNATGAAVPLYNTNAVWRLNGGVEFEFPLFLTLGADERVVLVPFNPTTQPGVLAAFRALFKVPNATRVFGPYIGSLNNDTDRIALERAQAPDIAGDPITWVIVDEVNYFDRSPWPTGANGQGRGLHRLSARVPGSEPTNWFAADPSPGSPSTPGGGDDDADDDGMPDPWETVHGLDPSNPADAALDLDVDGARNLDEYRAGTDPTQPGSVLRLSVNRGVPGSLTLVFTAVAGRAYLVEGATTLGGAWSTVQSISAGTQDREVSLPVDGNAVVAPTFWRVRLSE